MKQYTEIHLLTVALSLLALPGCNGSATPPNSNDARSLLVAANSIRESGGGKHSEFQTGALEQLPRLAFYGSRANYTISKSVLGWTVSQTAGSNTARTLGGGSYLLDFGDTSVVLDEQDNTSGKAYRLYQAAFNRVPDQAGLGYWIKALDTSSLEDIAALFMGSAEFIDAYGPNPANSALVAQFYQNVLHRKPDQAGLDYWIGILDASRATRAQVLAVISESAENKERVLPAIASGIEFIRYGAQPNDAIGVQPDYYQNVTLSSIATDVLLPLASPRTQNKTYFYRYGYTRAIAVIDINGDGLDDLLVAPTFFEQGPRQPIEFWINQGGGIFANQTAAWIDGPVPNTAFSTGIVTADFNGDGKTDIFLGDSGFEEYDCGVVGCNGSASMLLLSQPNGKYRDVSQTNLPGNTPKFNHVVSAVGDLNGDGRPDIAIPRLGSPKDQADGVVVWINQGQGMFSDETARILSDEIAYLPWTYQYSGQRPSMYDRQASGAVMIADLNNDGKAELVSCSYTLADRVSGKKTVRISSWNAATGKLVEVGRFQAAPAIAVVSGATGGAPTEDGTLGCAGIAAGDYDGDGVTDLLILWEAWNKSYVQLMKGKGNFTYVENTMELIGSYNTNFLYQGYTRGPSAQYFRDINGDGLPDILHRADGLSAATMASGMPTSLINDGHGHFVRQQLHLNGAAVAAAAAGAAIGCDWCSYVPLYGRFVARTDGRKALDLLLYTANEDVRTVPLIQERSVQLKVLRVR